MASNYRLLTAVLLIGASLFVLNHHIQSQLDSARALDQINVLFHSDPIIKLNAFSHGQAKNSWIIAHPNLANIFYTAIKFSTYLIGRVFDFSPEDEAVIRRQLGLLVVPVFSALNAVVLFLLFHTLNLKFLQNLLLTTLGCASFSQLIFGSVPDSFAINGFFITLTFLLGVHQTRWPRIHWTEWIILGTFGAGLTITNVVPMLIIFVLTTQPVTRSKRSSFSTSIVFLLLVFAATFLLSALGNLVRGNDLISINKLHSTHSYTVDYFENNGLNKIVVFPFALTVSITPDRINFIEDLSMEEYGDGERGRFVHRFTIEYRSLDVIYVVFMVIFFIGMISGARVLMAEGSPFREIAISALLILSFNGIFHAFWGSEYFLYSQHWLCSQLILLSGVFRMRGPYQRWIVYLFGVSLGWVILNNYWTITRMFRVLGGYLGT